MISMVSIFTITDNIPGTQPGGIRISCYVTHLQSHSRKLVCTVSQSLVCDNGLLLLLYPVECGKHLQSISSCGARIQSRWAGISCAGWKAGLRIGQLDRCCAETLGGSLEYHRSQHPLCHHYDSPVHEPLRIHSRYSCRSHNRIVERLGNMGGSQLKSESPCRYSWGSAGTEPGLSPSYTDRLCPYSLTSSTSRSLRRWLWCPQHMTQMIHCLNPDP